MTVLLDVRALSVNIANKVLLSTINVQLQHGDYLCVLGPNGAGKSTLLKALMGIINSNSGEIILNKTSLSSLSQKKRARKISYVPQAYGHQLDFSVLDFIKMARYAHHSVFSDWSRDDQNALEHALSITNTEDFIHRQMTTLSGGESQRVMIAAAVCQQAPLLLLDEPTSFLDPHHQVEVHHLIQTLNQQHGISIIEVSHDLNHATQHSKHILALKHGKVLWNGPSSDLLQSEHLKELYDQQFVFTTHPQTGATIALPSETSLGNKS